jgi:hypothetical protein
MSFLFERENQFAQIRDLVHTGPVDDGQLPPAKKSEWARIGQTSERGDGADKPQEGSRPTATALKLE